jgi:hypothetical protein
LQKKGSLAREAQIDAPTNAATDVERAQGKNTISDAICTVQERAYGTNHAHQQLSIFTATKFRASVEGDHSLTHETWIERVAKSFYIAKI